MSKLKNSLSMRRSPASGPLECMADFIDDDGVLRRSNSVTKRMALRGAPVGILATSLHPLAGSVAATEKPQDEEIAPLPPPAPVDLESALPREERMRRRTQLVSEIRDRKHSLLVEHNDRHQERLQLWHDAVTLDPAVETTSDNTAALPSPKSKAFVDDDGNLRRKTMFRTASGSGSADETRAPSGTSADDEGRAQGEDADAATSEASPSSGIFTKMFAPVSNLDSSGVGEVFETLASS